MKITIAAWTTEPAVTPLLCSLIQGASASIEDRSYMRHLVNDVQEFHVRARLQFPTVPQVPPQDDMVLASALVAEEMWELLAEIYPKELVDPLRAQTLAMVKQPLVADQIELDHLAKELIDCVVVLVRMGLAAGLPLQALWDAVHKSNMAKVPLGGTQFRPDGKVVKPVGWVPPDIKAVLAGPQQPSGTITSMIPPNDQAALGDSLKARTYLHALRALDMDRKSPGWISDYDSARLAILNDLWKALAPAEQDWIAGLLP